MGDTTPLYVALPIEIYKAIFEHFLGQAVIDTMLKTPIPFVLHDPCRKKIVRWIAALKQILRGEMQK